MFVLFPFALTAVWLVVFPLLRVRARPRVAQWSVMLAAFALTMAPWFAYNYVTLGRFTLSPAGGVGRGLWEGSWQATWSGRMQNELTHLADDIDDRAELDRRVTAVAAREQLPAAPMLEYVHQWEDIRRIWTEPTDPLERAIARVKADEEYRRVGIENIRRDAPAHLIKRLARGLFILWAGEIPFRYSEINALSTVTIRACWAIQAAHPSGRAVRRLQSVPRRTHRRGPGPAGADSLHLGGAFPAAHRSAAVAAGAADRAACWRQSARRGSSAIHFPSNRRFMNASICESQLAAVEVRRRRCDRRSSSRAARCRPCCC